MSCKADGKAIASPHVRSPDWMRKQKIERVCRWLRSCAACTSFLPPVDVFCDECWERLARIRNRHEGKRSLFQGGYAFPVYSLFTWTPETETLVKPLVYSLKNGWAPSVVERLAEWFSYERASFGLVRADAVVPAPGSGFDHAKTWAEALSRGIGRSTVDVLQKVPDQVRNQRTLRAEERAGLRFRLVGAQNAYRGPFAFADDVITTGSTAMAAYMALEDPRDFEVWTMVNRPRLAAPRGL